MAASDSNYMEFSPKMNIYLCKSNVIGFCKILTYDLQSGDSYVVLKFLPLHLVVAVAIVGKPCDLAVGPYDVTANNLSWLVSMGRWCPRGGRCSWYDEENGTKWGHGLGYWALLAKKAFFNAFQYANVGCL